MDTLSKDERSERMSRVRSKGSKAEMVVRRLVHGMGYRYRLHAPELPGKPDLVFRPRRKVIFVHGCFWHRHSDPKCKLARLPKSKQGFWVPKLEGNRKRDVRTQEMLEKMEWDYLVLWECELKDKSALKKIIKYFLDEGAEGETHEIY